MPTAAGMEAARTAAWAAMKKSDLTISDVSERSSVNRGTVGDFLNGKRWPRSGTLGQIENGLGLTPGTLEALGEEPGRYAAKDDIPPDLSGISDEQLLTELGYRMSGLKRELGRLQRQQSWRQPEVPDEGGGDEYDVPLTSRDEVGLAARTIRSRGKALARETDVRGEENQDDGGWLP